jgi:hypothetical protein
MSRYGKYSLAIVPLPKREAPKCEHKCHQGDGLNPWVAECPICHCANPKFDAVNGERLKQDFIKQMVDAGWTDFADTVAFLEGQ